MPKPNESLIELLGSLWGHLSSHRRTQFKALLALMLLAAFTEILSIGAVVPFLAVLASPDRIYEIPSVKPLFLALNITSSTQLLLPLTVAFGVATVIACVVRIMLLWVGTKFSFATGADLSLSIYRRTLYQEYKVHCSRNSSEIINAVSSKSNTVIYSIITPVIMLISSSSMLIAILATLFVMEPLIAIALFGGLGLIYALVILLTRRRLLANSFSVAHETTQVIKSLQEGLGGIRDVLIDGTQSTYCQIYQKSDSALRRAQGNSFFIGASPRYVIEAFALLLITALSCLLINEDDGVTKAIPVIGLFALGAQRLLPVLQQAYGSWVLLKSSQRSLQDMIILLDQPLPKHADQVDRQKLQFSHSISLDHLYFRYDPQGPDVLKDINFSIMKGMRIGFIGTTGSGKSTLLDLVMGLLQPTGGMLRIDGQVLTAITTRAWQAHVSHVPQTIFLADSSIEENIAFGVPVHQINHSLVRQVAQKAQISDAIEAWPMKYKTFVGERGIRLSGGQRQRIGIARALYKQSNVIIFDEATSALDTVTEQEVMDSIGQLSKDLTILIIAHRLTTLKNCSQIVELKNGSINRICSYQDITDHPTSFSMAS
jgi:ABC-type multidrug transport system fused ATPase/permease subunit